jgi:hypothetical protein
MVSAILMVSSIANRERCWLYVYALQNESAADYG